MELKLKKQENPSLSFFEGIEAWQGRIASLEPSYVTKSTLDHVCKSKIHIDISSILIRRVPDHPGTECSKREFFLMSWGQRVER